MEKNAKIAIYVSSPDSYSDVFNVFLECKNKYYQNCPFDIIVSTNTMEYDGIITYHSENKIDDWVSRTIPVLKEINYKYVLLMCDDIFFKNNPNTSAIIEIVNFMEQNNINYCRLKPSKKNKKINKYIGLLSPKTPYAMNLQIGIFNREFLISELEKESINAWKIEERWLNEAASHKVYYKDKIVVRKKIIEYIHGVSKGKWRRSALRKLKKNQINVDLKKRSRMTNKEELLEAVKVFFSKITPIKLRKKIKKFFKKIGIKFSSEC